MTPDEVRALYATLKSELMKAEMEVAAIQGRIRALQRGCDHANTQQRYHQADLTITCKDCRANIA